MLRLRLLWWVELTQWLLWQAKEKNITKRDVLILYVWNLDMFQYIFSWTCSWTREPDCYPSCLSSPISSLSSLKVRRLRWRNKTLMVWRLWNARTKTYTKNRFHTAPWTVQPRFAKSHRSIGTGFWFNQTASLQQRVQSYWTTVQIRESNMGCHHAVARTAIKTQKLWWSACWFCWLAAVVCDLDLFTVVLK